VSVNGRYWTDLKLLGVKSKSRYDYPSPAKGRATPLTMLNYLSLWKGMEPPPQAATPTLFSVILKAT